MSPFSTDLRDLRIRHGLRQDEVAERMGCEQTHISSFETGVRGPPKPEDVGKLAVAMGLDEDETERLMDAARRSQRRYVVPGDSSGQLFDFLTDLFADIHRLHPVQVEMMHEMLRLPLKLNERLANKERRIKRRKGEEVDR